MKMEFDYQPLVLTEPKLIELPDHPISSKALRNWLANRGVSFLERILLGIKPDDLAVFESTYAPPITTTKYPENNVGRVRYYRASKDAAVIILPQRGGGYNFAQLFASYLAANGISAYELETPFHGSRRIGTLRGGMPIELDEFKLMFRQAVTETRGLVDLVKEKKVGICGLSLGAIYASIVYGVHERISSGCLVMGGGNIADMLFESEDGFLRYLREEHLFEERISREMLRNELAEIEPCNYTKPNKSGNLLMINASRDIFIPPKCSEQLREAWGNPIAYQIPTTHLSAVLYTRRIMKKMLEHFQRTLMQD